MSIHDVLAEPTKKSDSKMKHFTGQSVYDDDGQPHIASLLQHWRSLVVFKLR